MFVISIGYQIQCMNDIIFGGISARITDGDADYIDGGAGDDIIYISRDDTAIGGTVDFWAIKPKQSY